MSAFSCGPRTLAKSGQGRATGSSGRSQSLKVVGSRPNIPVHARAELAAHAPPFTLQAKVRVGAATDPPETDAKRISDRVARIADPVTAAPVAEGGNSARRHQSADNQALLRRLETAASAPASVVHGFCAKHASSLELELPGTASIAMLIPAAIASARTDRANAAVRSGGAALPARAQLHFGHRFNHDFSRVRIHTGALAREAAHGLNTRAYTLGSNIAFASPENARPIQEGDALLAHELAHVVQQSRGNSAPVWDQSAALERSASSAGRDRSAGTVTVTGSSPVAILCEEAASDTPFLHRLDAVYAKALSLVPGPARKLIEGANETAKRWTESHAVTPQMLDHAVRSAEPVLTAAERLINKWGPDLNAASALRAAPENEPRLVSKGVEDQHAIIGKQPSAEAHRDDWNPATKPVPYEFYQNTEELTGHETAGQVKALFESHGIFYSGDAVWRRTATGSGYWYIEPRQVVARQYQAQGQNTINMRADSISVPMADAPRSPDLRIAGKRQKEWEAGKAGMWDHVVHGVSGIATLALDPFGYLAATTLGVRDPIFVALDDTAQALESGPPASTGDELTDYELRASYEAGDNLISTAEAGVTALDFVVPLSEIAEAASLAFQKRPIVIADKLASIGAPPKVSWFSDRWAEGAEIDYRALIRDQLKSGNKLTTPMKDYLRAEARIKWQDATAGVGPQPGGDYQLHHIYPLEHAHLFPELHPNDATNLALMRWYEHADWHRMLSNQARASGVSREFLQLARRDFLEYWSRYILPMQQ